MKQTRLLTIILVITLAAAIVYVLGDFNQQTKKLAAYTDQIENQKMALSNLPVLPAEIEKHLEMLSVRTAAALQAIANQNLNTTSLVDSLLTAAGKHQLAVSPISAGSWNYTTAGNARYRVLPVEMHIQGDLFELIAFLDQIDEFDSYPNLVVQTLSIIPTDQLLTNQLVDADHPVSAVLNLAIVVRVSDSFSGDNQ
ncbi:MAG TPA: hypothetical protein VLH15_11825 [Dehalococcoidales bacterium]|nr:hypothetical protein [Dehalococcoidales bacterium]